VPALRRGDLLPRIVARAPGPESRRYGRRLEAVEAPIVNTVVNGLPSSLWQEALGGNILDVDGNRWLDLTAGFGVAAIGHRHPRVVAAVRRQAGQLLHGLADVAAHPPRVRLGERLSDLAPLPSGRVHFAISGADAVEIAIKTTLLATDRPGLLVFDPAYHGTTFGALAATSRPAFRQAFRPHLTPHVRRLPFGCQLEAIERALEGHEIGGLLVEPIVGREGVLLPPPGWLAAVARACRRHHTLFVADEIFTGFGRTGSLFAVTAEGVEPDLLCCGKALGGGLPIAAVIGRDKWMAAWDAEGEARHTATFLAHPLACAAALATLEVLDEQDLAARAASLGASVEKRLAAWPGRFSGVLATRGRGLLWGIEMESRAFARNLTGAASAEGVLVLAGGPEGRVVQIVPPLTITCRQLDFALDVLERHLE
jgi:4-aminobutyrate aminotransferase-like enzyme